MHKHIFHAPDCTCWSSFPYTVLENISNYKLSRTSVVQHVIIEKLSTSFLYLGVDWNSGTKIYTSIKCSVDDNFLKICFIRCSYSQAIPPVIIAYPSANAFTKLKHKNVANSFIHMDYFRKFSVDFDKVQCWSCSNQCTDVSILRKNPTTTPMHFNATVFTLKHSYMVRLQRTIVNEYWFIREQGQTRRVLKPRYTQHAAL